MMRQSVLVTATIVLCLGFSVGATGTVFAWTESLLFQPLPHVPGLAQLVTLRTTTSTDQERVSYPAYKEIRDWAAREGTETFLGLAAFSIRRFNLRTEAAAEGRLAEPLWGVLASANYFDVLRVQPVLGRGFLATEDAVPRRAPVVVISHGLWQRRFAGDRDVLGRRVWINSREMTVVGVTPPGFGGTIARLAMDVWIPVTMHPEVAGNPDLLEKRGVRWLDVFGRLAPGASLVSARDVARAEGARLAASYAENRDLGLTARPLDIGPAELMIPLFTVMLGLSVLVVLIVCSNVANLLLLRGAAREHEIAVRLALGARPARIARQLMTESFVLAVGGILVAGAVLVWARNALNALLPASPLPIVVDTPIDLPVLLVLGAVGVSTIFAFGLAPALRLARVSVRASLTGAGSTRGGSRASGRLMGVLVSAQFALSLAVLVTAALFLRRLDELQRVDRGFRAPEEVVLNTVDFELSGVHDTPTGQILVERMVDQLRALPGVRAAAAATFVPLGFLGYSGMELHVGGYTTRPGESMIFLVNRVSGGYFDTMGIPILRGRPLQAADRDGSLPVAVVNEAFVRRFWASGDPIGRSIRIGDRTLTVVGVAADGKYEFLAPLDRPSPPFVYLALAQWESDAVVLHVRAGGDPLALVPSIQRTVASIDPRLSAMSPSTLDSYSSVPYLPVRVGSRVLSVLGAAALVLATVGLYAVIGYAVAQQRREIGIRMALGAAPARLVAHYLGYAARYAGAGALAGAALAAVIAYGLATRLPGSVPRVATAHLWPFALAVATLGVVAVLAALIPSNRAARVSPSAALRDE